jgi:D-alanyl-D-alanine carboxypeptidase
VLVIPGLPAIPVAVPDSGSVGVAALPPPTDAAPAGTPAVAVAAPVSRTDEGGVAGLRVTEAGQILWRHDDLLKGLDEVTEALIEPGRILLTAEDMPNPQPAPPTVMPEIVVRVSSSGGHLWAVDLGRHGSRFDAERTLLRVALAESATLGGGVRRVTEGSGYRAMILGLSRDQAQRACLRLESLSQTCSVIDP